MTKKLVILLSITVVCAGDISFAVERVGVLSENINNYAAITLNIGKSELKVSSKREAGSIKESLKWEFPFQEDPGVSVMVDVNFLMEISEKCPEFYLKISENGNIKKKVLVFQNDKFTQLLSTIVE